MKVSEFAKVVKDMLQTEKELFSELLEKEDWTAIEDEVFEYASNCDNKN